MNKDRHIISELNSFFAESNNTKAIQGIMNVMERIHINHRQMDFAKAANCKFTASQVLELMVLFPFFAIKNSLGFVGSVLGQMFACKKDMFYRFLSNEDINWRQIVYSVSRRLLGRIAMRSDSAKSTDPRCLIANDTDFLKTGRKGESLGRIFSHMKHSSILVYKGLFLLFTDGKTHTCPASSSPILAGMMRLPAAPASFPKPCPLAASFFESRCSIPSNQSSTTQVSRRQ